MNALDVQGLSKRYPSFALRDVSFCVPEGHIMGFIGRNGAGKTTTLKSLLGYVHPDAGVVQVFGQEFTSHEAEIKRQIGFVAGGVDYFPRKRLADITRVTRAFYPNWDDNAFARLTARFALDESKTPLQLSAGMRVKYQIALALSHHARLLILDEPTSGLDPVSRDELLDVLLTLAEEDGVSVLFSTHIIRDLEQCAHDITYIQRGRLLFSGRMADFAAGYRRISGTPEQLTSAIRQVAIGLRIHRSEFDGLLPVSQAPLAQEAGIACTEADAETVMVALERGETHESADEC